MLRKKHVFSFQRGPFLLLVVAGKNGSTPKSLVTKNAARVFTSSLESLASFQRTERKGHRDLASIWELRTMGRHDRIPHPRQLIDRMYIYDL